MLLQAKDKIDLADRQEERFFIPVNNTDKFLQGINGILKIKKFSECDIVETVYFNNLNHEVPWGISFKIRRYKKSIHSGKRIKLNPKQNYLLEIKRESDQGSFSRKKERLSLSIDKVLDVINQNDFSYSLYPYVGTEYQRIHFVPKSDLPLRVTVDKKTSYWYFLSNSFVGDFLGSEPYIRVEIKSHYAVLNSEEYNLVKRLLNNCGAKPIVSKKYMAYNLLCRHRTNLGHRFPKEIQNCEIEAKLLVNAKDSSHIFRIIQQIYSSEKEGFRTEKIFPYTFESASINSYFYVENEMQKEEALKFLFKGGWAKSLYKSNLEIVDNFQGLGCITKRQEIKFAPYFLYNYPQYQELCELRQDQLKEKIYFLGSLMRLRKVFWIESVKTGRLYHLSLDRCTYGDNRIHQLEIEYSASPNIQDRKNPEQFIIEDIAYITNQLITYFRQDIIPTCLTKFRWLENLI